MAVTLQQTSILARYGLAAELVSGKLVCFRNETGHVLASQSGLAARMELSRDGITSSATSAKASSTVERFVFSSCRVSLLLSFFDILQSCALSIRYKSAHAVLSYTGGVQTEIIRDSPRFAIGNQADFIVHAGSMVLPIKMQRKSFPQASRVRKVHGKPFEPSFSITLCQQEGPVLGGCPWSSRCIIEAFILLRKKQPSLLG